MHDIFDIRGGGERLALSLTQAINADLCFGKCSPNSFDLSQMHHNKKYDLGLRLEFPGLKTWALARLFKNKTHFLKDYATIIYSGVICPLAINNHPQGKNIFYCHTPPRFVYDKYQHYMQQNSLPKRLALKQLIKWYQPQYENAVKQMDTILTNSNYVKARIKKYLKLDAHVVYPPCDTQNYHNQAANGYYLSTARHDKLKRIDKIIAAFKQLPQKKPLICSNGSQTGSLKKQASQCPNISFSGQVSDKKLKNLIAQSIATIYIPKDEDFGMSPVESMAAGKPVICSGHGGPTESVINGQTGLYINEQNITQSLIACLQQLDTNKAHSMQKACQNQAALFDEKIFQKKIRQYSLSL